jgi:hypothetical protein
VKAVDLPFIGAVDGTRTRALAPINRRTLKNDPAISFLKKTGLGT